MTRREGSGGEAARPADDVAGERYAEPEELFGYRDPSTRPEATGVEKLVLKRDNLFLVANRLGDLVPAGARDLGFFLTDTRHLSAWRMTVEGGPPLCLSTQVSTDYVSQIDFTITGLHHGGLLGDEPVNYVHLRREQLIDGALVDRLVLTNYQSGPIALWLELEWAADFADVFEVRGAHRAQRGRYHLPAVSERSVELRYDGLDGRSYRTEMSGGASTGPGRKRHPGAARRPRGQGGLPPPARGLGGGSLHGARGRGRRSRAPVSSAERAAAGDAPGPKETKPFTARAKESALRYAAWAGACTGFSSSHEKFNGSLEQAVADLLALTVVHGGERVISAGIPWYTCPFGRDALIAGYEALLATPEVAKQALRFLASYQGTVEDPTRDEEPGKILHELRFGEMAAAGEVPHTPYYGSVDATPLFLILLSEYVQWTDDRELLARALSGGRARPRVDRAVRRPRR